MIKNIISTQHNTNIKKICVKKTATDQRNTGLLEEIDKATDKKSCRDFWDCTSNSQKIYLYDGSRMFSVEKGLWKCCKEA